MQFCISLVLIFACFFPKSEAGVTQAMLDLFAKLASGSPPVLTKEKFAEFVGEVFKSGKDLESRQSNIDAWYKVFPQKPTKQEMIDFCRVYGDLLKESYFTMPPAAAKTNDGKIAALYDTCDDSEYRKLTLVGLTKFVTTAFTGVTQDTINTWDKLVNAIYKFDFFNIKFLCKNNADKLTEKYVNR